MAGWAALLCVAGGGAVAAPGSVDEAAPDRIQVGTVRDLNYGDGLFYFFQGESLESLTRFEAYSRWQQMPNHQAEADLLLGGLYLELGLHNEAGARFEQLLGPQVPVGVRNRAWFYLARVWYARGYDERAEQALRRLQGVLDADLESQRMHLLANVLMRQSRFGEAADLLDGWQGPDTWAAYARFNLGAALIRDNQLDVGARYLDAVGVLDTTEPELVALRDRANLALGFAWLQSGEADRARPVLQRVRLKGTYASRALLGAGWAEAELGDFRAALTPWLELKERSLQDPAVQESWLAIPYAYARLDAPAQAAEYYEAAIAAFQQESQRIDAAIARVDSGALLDSILEREGRGEGYGWFYQLRDVPGEPESTYLYAMFAGHDFQEGLKNFRDLAYLERMLARWTDSFGAYESMIDTRERAFAQRLPQADDMLGREAGADLRRRRDVVASRLDAAAAQGDAAALGTPEQREQWRRILAAEDAIVAAPASPELDALRDKLRLAKGVLYWQLAEAFRGRLFAERRELRAIDAALVETQQRTDRLRVARESVQAGTGSYRERVGTAGTRLAELRQRLEATRQLQSRHLTQLAVRELRAQKDRLAAYQVQARFALAAIYDRAATSRVGPAVPAAEASAPAPGDPGEALIRSGPEGRP
jgi:hypothetical protein